MNTSPTASLVDQAVQRLCAALPPQGPFAVLLQGGAGPKAEAAARSLRSALAAEPRFVLSSVQRKPAPPVADPGGAGGHVNPEVFTVQPPPRLVLRVSEAAGKLYIAARDPGSDPLGPPDAGWLWVLESAAP